MCATPRNPGALDRVFRDVTVLARHPKQGPTPADRNAKADGQTGAYGPAFETHGRSRGGPMAGRAPAATGGRQAGAPGTRVGSSTSEGKTSGRARRAAKATSQRAAVVAVQRQASVGQAGGPRSLGTAAAPRRAAHMSRRSARPPRYVYRLVALDDLLADAHARTNVDLETRRAAMNRRTNWRVIGIVVVVAIGLGVAAAGVINQAVSIVMNMFAA